MTKVEELKRHLRPGRVYRRGDLAQWSKAVDRHLKQLVDEGTLTKLAPRLYLYPKETAFGKAPAEDKKLVATFLKDHRFLLASPNAYDLRHQGWFHVAVMSHGVFRKEWWPLKIKGNFWEVMRHEKAMFSPSDNASTY